MEIEKTKQSLSIIEFYIQRALEKSGDLISPQEAEGYLKDALAEIIRLKKELKVE